MVPVAMTCKKGADFLCPQRSQVRQHGAPHQTRVVHFREPEELQGLQGEQAVLRGDAKWERRAEGGGSAHPCLYTDAQGAGEKE